MRLCYTERNIIRGHDPAKSEHKIKLSLKKIIIIVVILAVAISIGTAAALFFLLKPEKMTTDSASSNTETATVASADLGGIDANKLLASLKKTIPTVTAAYSYDKTHDPLSKLGASGSYTGGISFYDTRTGAKPNNNYTAEAGGSIEVFKTVADATKRSNSLAASQYGQKDRAGDTVQVDRFVMLSSSKLDAKAQAALLSSLSQIAMSQLSQNDVKTDEANP